MADNAMASRTVRYVDLARQYAEERDELLPLLDSVLAGGQFVGSEDIERLETELAAFCGTQYAVAVNSGTDALILGMKALGIGPGDEVITPPNSFIASTGAIVALGATPVFADVLENQNIDPDQVERAITPRTKAVMPVHLTGRLADMDTIGALAERHGLFVVEDAAQAIGSRFAGRLAGSFGDIGCFSLHPLKNLNACGDAGFITTNRKDVVDTIRRVRDHGLISRDTATSFGTVSRMSSLQAAIVRFRLARLPAVIEARRANASLYRARLNPNLVYVPADDEREFNTFHTFVVQIDHRDEVQKSLADRGIGSAIHYPKPIHLQPAAAQLGSPAGSFPATERQAGRILSLPIHQFLTTDDIEYVAANLNAVLGELSARGGHSRER